MSNCRVMIVNCFADEREMYVQSLEFGGYDPVDVCDAEEAFQTAVQIRPAVVITDTVLTGGAGLELIRALRRDPQTRDVTIVVVTGRAFPADRVAAEQAGADLVLVKPCPPDTLVEAVNRACAARPRHVRAAG